MGRSIRLSDKAIAWWEAQPGAQTCRDCGKQGSKAYVQPQLYKDYALCGDCIGRINIEARAKHKAALDAMPKCEACGKHRGTWKVGVQKVLMCGRCKNTEREYHRSLGNLGGMALFLPPGAVSREELLNMAKGNR